MTKIMKTFEKRLLPLAAKIGTQRHLMAIRDGFVAIMPIIIIGSLAILLNNFPSEHFQQFMFSLFGDTWKSIGTGIGNGSYAILSILATLAVSYKLSRTYHLDGLSTSLISVSALIILIPIHVDGGLSLEWTSSQGLFVAILTALIVPELFRLLLKSKWTISMPDSVPEGVKKSFRALIPALIILLLFSFLNTVITLLNVSSVHEFIYRLIQEPLQELSNTLFSAIIVSFSSHLLWFFGLHGSNILGPIIEPLYLPLIMENQAIFNSGISAFDVPYIITKPFFDVFVYMGGIGTTLALLIAILFVAKTKHYRTIGKVSTPVSFFNINEPVLFGLPIVLNPLLLVPFLLVPTLLTITSFWALQLGFVPKTVAILPWTTPPFISGYLVTGGDIRGVLLQMFNLTLAVCIYIPFVLLTEKSLNKQLQSP
ncbi:PTS sugar transporter subunit IIC [Alkalihalobacillus sp. 1P02AB]|uniref:PTS sugar transporter subunit IIC n=1 Tax=Alkalihalobacillus sp. 1P02AB TaxID=3132260 RepID=UPI0039A6100F